VNCNYCLALAEIEEKYSATISQLTAQQQKYKEHTERVFKQKDDEIASLRDTIEVQMWDVEFKSLKLFLKFLIDTSCFFDLAHETSQKRH
jgi:predicted nucleic acid-binding protein